MQRVRDVVYRKGTEIRQVFHQLDDDKSGYLDHHQFRFGLNKMGAYISDEEWEILLDVVDNNRDGKIQYIEFAETMKVNLYTSTCGNGQQTWNMHARASCF